MSYQILNMDCVDAMSLLIEDNSVDAIVTDPPYGLSFMGKKWDYDVPSVDVWREAFRVLKPGGHLLAFAGTRTQHRMAVNIEDAGFEIRDLIAWVYGCLSDDTEILTEHGWKRGVDVAVGEQVAAWDSATGAITLEPVRDKTIAPWDGSMVRFVNDDTDQLLTPNHRVYHRPRQREMVNGVRSSTYGDIYEVAEAGQIGRWNPIKLPCAGLHNGPGIGGDDYAALLGWIWSEGGFDRSPSTGVRIYQSESANPDKVKEIDTLIARLVPAHKRYDRARTYTYKCASKRFTETCWFFTGQVADRVRIDLPDKRPNWELLWRMSLSEKRAFWGAAMKGDGCGDDFYQKHYDDLVWAQALVAMIGWRGKIGMRKAPRTGGGLCVTPRATTELQCRHLKTETQHYTGDVWCVKVRTGAFVARRNGKVFITGNSGFPKSLDVSKAIDKAAGAEREIVGRGASGKTSLMGGLSGSFGEYGHDITAPATEAAKRWQGWGTALKPALEPITVARKPLVGTVASNVLEWGTGALNVDGCRVETAEDLNGGAYGGEKRHRAEYSSSDTSPDAVTLSRLNRGVGTYKQPAGRWPANLIHDGSDEVLAAFPDAPGQMAKASSSETRKNQNTYGEMKRGSQAGEPRAEIEKSAARFFYCAKASKSDRGDGNTHPTVKPLALMRYLCRLVTPPGGLILDPFTGSGSTGVAALVEGFRFLGIEREEAYVAIARARLARQIEQMLKGAA